jgi:hypothetical protein
MANTDSKQTLTFEVFRGGQLVKTAELAEQSVTIGSGASALLPVAGEGVAELHAVINIEDDGSISLLDLGSEGGVKVNGEAISNAVLKSGGAFELGELRIVVHGAQPAAASPGPLAASESGDDDLVGAPIIEDVMDFIMRSGTATSNLGVNKKRPKVLEVNQIWGDVLLDTKHFSTTSPQDVTIGAEVGWRWHFLGVDMGWVPAPLHMVLPLTPPMWSEVNSDWRDDFYAPDTNLPSGNEHTLFRFDAESNAYVAIVAGTWDGFADVGSKRYSFDELVGAGLATKTSDGFEIPITEDLRLMVDVDGVVFFNQMVLPGQRLLSRSTQDVDYPFMAIFSLMGFIGILFAFIMFFSPKPAENELLEIPDRFVELLLEKPEPEKKEKKKPDNNPDAGEGAKAKKEEGKVGKKRSQDGKSQGQQGRSKEAGARSANCRKRWYFGCSPRVGRP